MSTDQLTAREAALAKIPAFSPVILRVLELLSKDECDLLQISREITADATLSAQLLKVANSALFGLSYRVDTVQKAAVAVGNSWIRQLTVAVAASSYMKGAYQTQELGWCWRHTLATAVLAREIGKAAGLPAEQAYTVGLLHDIGRLGLLAAYPSEYQEAIRAANGRPSALLREERNRFGADHCEVGSWLMEEWHLPADFGSIIGNHHDSPDGDAFDLRSITHLACRIADALGYPFLAAAEQPNFEEERLMLPEFAQAQMSADPEVLVALIEDAIAGRGLELPAPAPCHSPEPEAPVVYEPPLFEAARNHSVNLAYVLAAMVTAAGVALLLFSR